MKETLQSPVKSEFTEFSPNIEGYLLPAAERIDVNHKDFMPLKKIGKGSFGDVYLVRHLKSGKIYAMKILSKRKNADHHWMRYVMTERNVLIAAKNPYITNLNYAFQTKRNLFLVLDFCPGGDLEKILQHDRYLTEDKCKVFTAELVLALA